MHKNALSANEENNHKYNWKIENRKAQNIAKIVIEGTFSVEGHFEMLKDVVSQSFWKAGMNLCIDDRKVTFGKTDIDLINKVSRGFSSFEKEIGNGKTAIIMNSLSDYTRGRQFQLLTDDKVSTQIRIFMDEEAAVAWLTA